MSQMTTLKGSLPGYAVTISAVVPALVYLPAIGPASQAEIPAFRVVPVTQSRPGFKSVADDIQSLERWVRDQLGKEDAHVMEGHWWLGTEVTSGGIATWDTVDGQVTSDSLFEATVDEEIETWV